MYNVIVFFLLLHFRQLSALKKRSTFVASEDGIRIMYRGSSMSAEKRDDIIRGV